MKRIIMVIYLTLLSSAILYSDPWSKHDSEIHITSPRDTMNCGPRVNINQTGQDTMSGLTFKLPGIGGTNLHTGSSGLDLRPKVPGRGELRLIPNSNSDIARGELTILNTDYYKDVVNNQWCAFYGAGTSFKIISNSSGNLPKLPIQMGNDNGYFQMEIDGSATMHGNMTALSNMYVEGSLTSGQTYLTIAKNPKLIGTSPTLVILDTNIYASAGIARLLLTAGHTILGADDKGFEFYNNPYSTYSRLEIAYWNGSSLITQAIFSGNDNGLTLGSVPGVGTNGFYCGSISGNGTLFMRATNAVANIIDMRRSGSETAIFQMDTAGRPAFSNKVRGQKTFAHAANVDTLVVVGIAPTDYVNVTPVITSSSDTTGFKTLFVKSVTTDTVFIIQTTSAAYVAVKYNWWIVK